MTNFSEPHSTLLMTTSLKGGTGKSLFACAMVDLLRREGRPVAAYDGDGVIGSLFAMHATRDENCEPTAVQDPLTGVETYDIRGEDRTNLILGVERHKGMHVHDLAGGALADLKRIFDDQDGLPNLFKAFDNLEIRPIFCHLITPDKATVRSMALHFDMMDNLGELGKIAGHIGVVNYRGMQRQSGFPFWYGFQGPSGEDMGGKTRDRLFARGGVEMVLPHMDEGTLALIKSTSMPLSLAVDHAPFNIVLRQRTRLFVNAFADAVTPEVRAILGIQHG